MDTEDESSYTSSEHETSTEDEQITDNNPPPDEKHNSLLPTPEDENEQVVSYRYLRNSQHAKNIPKININKPKTKVENIKDQNIKDQNDQFQRENSAHFLSSCIVVYNLMTHYLWFEIQVMSKK